MYFNFTELMLKIKLNIANRIYPLNIDPGQEEIMRKASKTINEMVKDFEAKYAVKDKQDSLAMCALHILTKIKIDNNSGNEDNDQIAEVLKKIEKLIDSNS